MAFDALSLIILALATWRLAFFVSKENAPFHLMARIRDRFPLGGGATCIYCMSFWAALVMLALWFGGAQIVVYVFAVSGLALMAGNYSGASSAQ